MNLIECTTPLCSSAEHFDGETPDGWQHVLARKAPEGVTLAMFQGVCPSCIEASKPKRKFTGGTVFDPAELEAGGRVVEDKQRKLF